MTTAIGLPEDPWEMRFRANEVQYTVENRPSSLPEEVVRAKALEFENTWRRLAFVNCWSATAHESHALWKIYCGRDTGVALQTTLGRLAASLKDIPLYRVRYLKRLPVGRTPGVTEMATRKRPMFAYEQEVRALYKPPKGQRDPNSKTTGFGLPWDPEECRPRVLIHPNADEAFRDTVDRVVQDYAPRLSTLVGWSQMRDEPHH